MKLNRVGQTPVWLVGIAVIGVPCAGCEALHYE
jgi:hypothetical protein